MSNHNEKTLKEAINQLLETYKLKDKLTEVDILSRWEQLMGTLIAKHTTNVYIKNKKLFLELDSAPLKQELSYAKDKIITILNADAGEQIIKEIIIR